MSYESRTKSFEQKENNGLESLTNGVCTFAGFGFVYLGILSAFCATKSTDVNSPVCQKIIENHWDSLNVLLTCGGITAGSMAVASMLFYYASKKE